MLIDIPAVNVDDSTRGSKEADQRLRLDASLMLIISIAVDDYDPSCIRSQSTAEPRY